MTPERGPMNKYRCKGCNDIDSIVEISVVPRIMEVLPTPEKYATLDEVFWESDVSIGYGCRNETCKFWHGDFGIPRPVSFDALTKAQLQPRFVLDGAPMDPLEIAEIISD